MKVMLLAAGRGDRLKPLTNDVPKPLLVVGGERLLVRQLRALKQSGVSDVVINLHHLGDQIEAACGDGSAFGLAIRYSHEAELLDTGGGIVRALPLLGKDPFIVLNGDIYTDFPFTELPRTIPSWADVHLVLTTTPDFREHGDFDVNMNEDRITRRGNDYVYCGIGLLRPQLFHGRPAAPFSLRDILFEALQHNRASAQVWHGFWTDIGTPEQLREANERSR